MTSRNRSVPDAGTDVASLLIDRARRLPGQPLVEIHEGAHWRPVTAAEFHAHVRVVAAGLVAVGVRPRQSVGIMSRTRYEWMLLDFALWYVGAVPVPIYETASAAQVAWIARDATLTAVIAETADNARVIEAACPDLATRSRIWRLDEGVIDMLLAAGSSVDPGEVEERRSGIRPDDVATIVYTSGTTGRAKGVELTHANLTVQAATIASVLRDVVAVPDARLLLVLPLAHVYARVIQLVGVASHTTIGHGSPATLAHDLGTFRPTYLVVVPRMLERIHAAAEDASGSDWRRTVFRWATDMAIAHSRAIQTHEGPSRWDTLLHGCADALVYRRLRRSLGGALRQVIVGGSALREPVGHFFRGAGLDVLEGYGLTETSAPITVNRPRAALIGSVGLPLSGTDVTIAPDGEVLVRGRTVFRGYHDDPGGTADALRDGWLHTGDLGRLDSRGNLFITGRIKDLIATSSGKNVCPAVLEEAVRAHPLIAECVVVGDGRPFVAALVTLDPEALPRWCTLHHRPPLTLDAARTDAEVLASLRRAVEVANLVVSRAEAIRDFRVLDRALTIESGHLTPSLKGAPRRRARRVRPDDRRPVRPGSTREGHDPNPPPHPGRKRTVGAGPHRPSSPWAGVRRAPAALPPRRARPGPEQPQGRRPGRRPGGDPALGEHPRAAPHARRCAHRPDGESARPAPAPPTAPTVLATPMTSRRRPGTPTCALTQRAANLAFTTVVRTTVPFVAKVSATGAGSGRGDGRGDGRGTLVVLNHRSPIDFPVAAVACRRWRLSPAALSRADFFDRPLAGPGLRLLGAIPAGVRHSPAATLVLRVVS
jgi:long-chain acyl-CoA synthetase